MIAEERYHTFQYLEHETMDPEDVAKEVAELRAEAAELKVALEKKVDEIQVLVENQLTTALAVVRAEFAAADTSVIEKAVEVLDCSSEKIVNMGGSARRPRASSGRFGIRGREL